MIDLHTHTIFSDGELIPSELIRRFEVIGYSSVALTDHADSSNLDFIVPRIKKVAEVLNQSQSVKVLPGVELTHLAPNMMSSMVKKARELGAVIVVVHGESIVEPVMHGTNRAAIEAEADILAHPGLITLEEARLAADKGVFLEISGRAGHSLSNGHVAKCAVKAGAKLILNSDAHAPHDLMNKSFAQKVVEGAGLKKDSLEELLVNSRSLIRRIIMP